MFVSKRGKALERNETEREVEVARRKKQEAMVEYIAALDYPEILPEEEEDENGKQDL